MTGSYVHVTQSYIPACTKSYMMDVANETSIFLGVFYLLLSALYSNCRPMLKFQTICIYSD